MTAMRRLGVLAACIVVAARAAEPVPVADFFAHAERGHFRLSADGRQLAWLGQAAGAHGERRTNVFVQALDGAQPIGAVRQLTHDLARDIPDIAWKGSATILFRQDAGGDEDFHVFALDVASAGLRDLTPGEHLRAALLDALPDDADHVLVTSDRREPGRKDVWRIDLRGGAPELVARNPGDVTDWLTDHRGRVRLALRGEGLQLTWLHRADEAAAWKPIATTDYRVDLSPKFFDADDRKFYALSNRGRDKEALVLIDPARPDEEQVLFEPADVDASDAAWSQAGHRLLRVDYLRDRPEHRFFDAGEERLWQKLSAKLPGEALSLQSATAAEDKFIVAADDDRSPGTRHVYDAKTDTLATLGAINPRLPAQATVAMKPVEYRARDGLPIHGYLTLPAGSDAKRLACVVHPHGGPWTRDEWGWNAEVQFLASRGLCVLQMNFRGSTGYGRRFKEAGFREWGGAMQRDVDDGAAWLVAQGIADPKRLAIVGASYGGYVALAGVTLTPGLYAAAVDMAGISDLTRFLDELPTYARAQLPELHDMIGDPERADDRARLAAASPALHVERIVAPLLVAQGARDPRVPRAGTDALVAALRKQGVEVEYLLREDEGHGFRNEENQLAYYAAMEKFLVRHLRPPQMPGK